MAFLTKRQDMKRSEFQAWYEENHVPTIIESMPGIIDYRRNFLPETIGGVDVVTEITFPDTETYDRAMALAFVSPALDRIQSDQRMLFGPDGIRITLVEKQGGPVP